MCVCVCVRVRLCAMPPVVGATPQVDQWVPFMWKEILDAPFVTSAEKSAFGPYYTNACANNWGDAPVAPTPVQVGGAAAAWVPRPGTTTRTFTPPTHMHGKRHAGRCIDTPAGTPAGTYARKHAVMRPREYSHTHTHAHAHTHSTHVPLLRLPQTTGPDFSVVYGPMSIAFTNPCNGAR